MAGNAHLAVERGARLDLIIRAEVVRKDNSFRVCGDRLDPGCVRQPKHWRAMRIVGGDIIAAIDIERAQGESGDKNNKARPEQGFAWKI
jgi:hypothetical protein